MLPGLNTEINEAVDRTGLFAVPPSTSSEPQWSLMKTNRYTKYPGRDRWIHEMSSDYLTVINSLD